METSDNNGKAFFDAIEQTRKHALANPCRTEDEYIAALSDSRHRLAIANGTAGIIAVLLTVSSSDDDAEELFWHASASFQNHGKAKKQVFWTARDKEKARRVLETMLDRVGVRGTRRLYHSATALHLTFDLTEAEYAQTINLTAK